MNSPLRINIFGPARAQIEEAAAWRAENRPSAPGAVRHEPDRILGLPSVQPDIGARARSAKLRNARRVEISRIRCFLYYRVADDRLEVPALWHASRGREPQS